MLPFFEMTSIAVHWHTRLFLGFWQWALVIRVFLWSEGRGVDYPPFRDLHHSNYVTSLSFSSDAGGKSILAVARRSGRALFMEYL